jgi:hypothetical protein
MTYWQRGLPVNHLECDFSLVRGLMVSESSLKQGCRVTHETLAKYVGSYELTPSIFIIVSLDGDQFRLSGHPARTVHCA